MSNRRRGIIAIFIFQNACSLDAHCALRPRAFRRRRIYIVVTFQSFQLPPAATAATAAAAHSDVARPTDADSIKKLPTTTSLFLLESRDGIFKANVRSNFQLQHVAAASVKAVYRSANCVRLFHVTWTAIHARETALETPMMPAVEIRPSINQLRNQKWRE